MKLRGSQADQEVRLMAEAGLVDATFDDGKTGSFTSITRLTAAGETFLRAFKGRLVPGAKNQAEAIASAAMVSKWKANYDSGLLPFRVVA
jgi:hypothetical protein